MTAEVESRIAIHGALKHRFQEQGLLRTAAYVGEAELDLSGDADDASTGNADAQVASASHVVATVYAIHADTLARMDQVASDGTGSPEPVGGYQRRRCETDYGAVWVYTQLATGSGSNRQAETLLAGQRDNGVVRKNPLARGLSHQLLGMALMLGFLFLVSYVSVIGNRFVIVSLFLILWGAITVALFWLAKKKRSLFLIHVRNESPWARWLAGGIFMLAVRFVIAALSALGLFIGLSQGIGSVASIALVAGIVYFSFANRITRNSASKHLESTAAVYYSGRVSFWLVSILLLLCVSVASLWVRVPDLSELSFHDTLLWGYAQADGKDELLRQVAGLWTMTDAARIWLAEQVSSNGFSFLWKTVGWLLVLLQQFLFIVSALFLIHVAGFLAERIGARRQSDSNEKTGMGVPTPVIGFVGAVVLLLFLWNQLVPAPWASITGKTMLLRVDGHTYQLSPDEFDATMRKEFSQLDKASQQVFITISDKIDSKLDNIFEPAIDHIPTYADWYYSISGEVQKTAAILPIYDVSGKVMKTLFPENNLEEGLESLDLYARNAYADAQQVLEADFVAGMKRLLAPFETHPHRQYESIARPLDLEAAYSDYLSEMLGVDQTQKRLAVAGTAAAAALLAPKAIKAATETAKTKASQAAKNTGRAGKKAESTSRIGRMFGTVTRPVKNAYAASKMWAANNRVIGPAARFVSRTTSQIGSKIGSATIVKAGARVASRVGTRTVALLGAERVFGPLAAGAACSVVPGLGTAVCAAGAFVGITVVTELAELKYDEYKNRDDLEDVLEDQVNTIRENVRQRYQRGLMDMLHTDAHKLRASVMAQARPIDYVL